MGGDRRACISRGRTARGLRGAACAAGLGGVALLAAGCAWLPDEFNLSPLYYQRLDESGELLELDVLWPLIHYEQTPEGGDDFRIRPFYRHVTEPEQQARRLPATEHQYLWPLGRIRSDPEQSLNRFFPLWSYAARLDAIDGARETNWYFLFPFFWGGSSEDGEETYFGVFPIYADLPQFLTYDRLRFILWPLYTGTEKDGRFGHVFLWPLAGFGYGPEGYSWHRFLPFYSVSLGREYRRYSVLFPFVHWGVESLDSDDPVSRFFLWPLYGRMWSQKVASWTFLWPLFQRMRLGDRIDRIDFPWPFIRIHEDRSESSPIYQWWLWPLIARTITDDQWAWNFLWPLIWLRRFADPEGEFVQRTVVPFYWYSRRERNDGSGEEFVKYWPLAHHWETRGPDGEPLRGQWRALSLLPWRQGNLYGVEEAYGWLWTLARGWRRAPDDTSVQLAANLFTTRRRGDRRQTSVPFLFNYTGDDDGGVVRLFQFIPIPW